MSRTSLRGSAPSIARILLRRRERSRPDRDPQQPVRRLAHVPLPDPRQYVAKDWDGPFLLTGGAGTGKTVVAMHRARELASRFEERGDDGKILFTTFTTSLADALASTMDAFCSPEVARRIEVLNVDRLPARVLAQGEAPLALVKVLRFIDDRVGIVSATWRNVARPIRSRRSVKAAMGHQTPLRA